MCVLNLVWAELACTLGDRVLHECLSACLYIEHEAKLAGWRSVVLFSLQMCFLDSMYLTESHGLFAALVSSCFLLLMAPKQPPLEITVKVPKAQRL